MNGRPDPTRRWLVTGADGMLGRDLVSVLSATGRSVTAVGRHQLDITDPDAVRTALAGHDLVINAAAWTDVDAAEQQEAAATRVNGTAVAYLAESCAATGARLVHVSTDYVFAGDATEPYPEHARTSPVNAYGRSKLVGERAVLSQLPEHGYVVRTAWLYATHGRNFVRTVLRLAAEREYLDVVDDQIGQPTWSYALACRLVELAEGAVAGRAPAGIYHGTCTGQTSWYGLARAILALSDLDPTRIRPVGTELVPRPARRPAYSVLGHHRWSAAGLAPLPHWRDTLAAALTERRSAVDTSTPSAAVPG